MIKVSRSSLEGSQSESSGDEQSLSYMNHIELDFIEVADGSGNEGEDEIIAGDGQKGDSEAKDEYDFPLFSVSSAPQPSTEVIGEEGETGASAKTTYSDVTIMKVSLNESIEENINNDRPMSYYFASYTEDERERFSAVAVSGDDIISASKEIYTMPTVWAKRVLDIDHHNMMIESGKEKERSRKRKRPGKKKRQARIECKERKASREKIQKQIEKQKEAKLKKKLFHKRGGKKHKKSNPSQQSQKKYRTE